MIGLYTQNHNTLTQLLKILANLPIEPYNPKHLYTHVICLTNKAPQCSCPVLYIKDLNLPLSFSEWRLLIQKLETPTICYRNQNFYFDYARRMVTNLQTSRVVSLTEKESDILAFLIQTPNHRCDKETLLHSVWGYHPETETHTLESHIYTLKQKLGSNSDNLFQLKDGVLFLI